MTATPCAGGLTRRQFLTAAAGGAATIAVPATLRRALAADSGRKPNFVVIFTDDQGYQDIGCFGSPDIKTPRLDRMAEEGMKFTDFYVAAPVCTPSRAALMTGCYPCRVGLARGVLWPGSQTGLHGDEVTIAELLKARGYATCCIGKWHLGSAPQFLPTSQGFDSYFGIPYSNDMSLKSEDGRRGPPLMRDARIVEHPANQATLTERYTQEAVRFLTANRARPFFLYLPHTMPHVPLHVSERFKGKSKRGLYGDVIECLDWSTGEILDTIRKLGLDDHTLVVFTSDNGPWLGRGAAGGTAKPLRGGKFDVYEGGLRVPCIMRWPGRIPRGRTCSELATTMDLYPTLARLAGAAPPPDRVIDGRDIAPLMAGAPGAKSPHEAFFYHDAGGRLGAVRSGKWKLHLPYTRRRKVKKPKKDRKGAPAATRPAVIEEKIPPRLYDLAADVGETTDLADKHPDVVKRLTDLAARFGQDLQATSRPVGRVAGE